MTDQEAASYGCTHRAMVFGASGYVKRAGAAEPEFQPSNVLAASWVRFCLFVAMSLGLQYEINIGKRIDASRNEMRGQDGSYVR